MLLKHALNQALRPQMLPMPELEPRHLSLDKQQRIYLYLGTPHKQKHPFIHHLRDSNPQIPTESWLTPGQEKISTEPWSIFFPNTKRLLSGRTNTNPGVPRDFTCTIWTIESLALCPSVAKRLRRFWRLLSSVNPVFLWSCCLSGTRYSTEWFFVSISWRGWFHYTGMYVVEL